MPKVARLPTRARLARVALVLVLVWLLASGVLLILARQRADAGLASLQEARAQLTAQALLEGKGLHALDNAEQQFSSAHSIAANPVLAPWSVVPIINHNLSSIRDLTGAAQQVARVGATTAREGSALLRQHPVTAADRLAVLSRLQAIAAQANRRVANVDPGPRSQLLGPVASARQKFDDKLTRLRTATSDAAALAAGAQHLLVGPRHYLVLAANNAEMRAGSGMFLEAGVATFSNGSFTMGSMTPTPLITVPAGAVPVPPALAGLWGWTQPSQSWRNLATSPRFDVAAPLAAQMWQAITGQSVDGVLAVDPLALNALLGAQGPIDAAGQHLTGDNVVDYLLLNQYAGLPNNVDPTARYDQLGTVAAATVNALSTRPWQLSSLVTNLSEVGKGRHILAWAKDPVEERAWRAAGVDGALHTDSLAVSVLNFGGNKLDQFLQVDAHLAVDPAPGGYAARLTVKLRNTAPTGLSGYVAGPNSNTDLVEGEYQGILAVNVPGVASLPTLRGVSPLLVAGVDGPTKVVAGGYFQLPRGQTLTATVTFRLPAGLHEVLVEPSARAPAIHWSFRSVRTTDAQPEHFAW